MKDYTTRDIIDVLKSQIEYLKTEIREHSTGHIHTAISVLNHRIQQLEQQFLQEQQTRNR
jgi:prefoldin subunit 5